MDDSDIIATMFNSNDMAAVSVGGFNIVASISMVDSNAVDSNIITTIYCPFDISFAWRFILNENILFLLTIS